MLKFTYYNTEKDWFHFAKRNLRNLFPNVCDRARFNKTKLNILYLIKNYRFLI